MVKEMNGFEKIGITLPKSGNWPPAEVEWVWAEPLENGLYKIANVPFYAVGLAYGDIVSVAKQVSDEGSSLFFAHVISRSGHSTYRLLVFKGSKTPGFLALWAELARLGCTYEAADGKFIAVDMGPSVDVHAAYRILERGCAENVWDFDEGHYAGRP